MVACTGRAGTDFDGLSLAIAKESNGGSNNGTEQVARSLTLDFLDPSGPTCSNTGVAVGASGALGAYTFNFGCTGTTSEVPDAGVADVEAALFLSSTAADIAALNAEPLFQIIFAPAVSTNLYRELQDAQGLTQDDAPENIPQLTRAQITAIFNGSLLFWDEFQTDSGGDFLAGEDIIVCRRGNDSGTQASFASFYLNERCNASVPGFVAPDVASCEAEGCDWDASFGSSFVFAADGSSDVRSCLDFHNANGNFAIGVLSTNTTYNDTDRRFRFIGHDGGVPTLASTADGAYHFVTENVLNTRTPAPSGVPGDLVDYIVDNIGLPAIVSGLNESSRQTGGIDTGILSVPNGSTITVNAPPNTLAGMRTNPVSSHSRSVGGSSNNCQPQSAVSQGQVIGGNQ